MSTDATLSGLRALRGLEQAQEACLTVYQVERLDELPEVIEKQAADVLLQEARRAASSSRRRVRG